MDIEFSSEMPAAVLNPFSGTIYPVDGTTSTPCRLSTPPPLPGPTAEMFMHLGGELQELSDTGGKGVIPDENGFVQCGVLCVDERLPKIPVTATLSDGGPRCIVTANKGVIDAQSTVIVVHQSDRRGTEVYFGPNYGTAVCRMLYEPAKVRASATRNYTFKMEAYGLVGNPEDKIIRPRTVEAMLYDPPLDKLGVLGRQRLLELIFWGDLYSPGVARWQKPWERVLGVSIAVDGNLYYSVGGILRKPVPQPYNWRKQFPWVTFVDDPRPGFTEGDLVLKKLNGKNKNKGWRLYGKYPLRSGSRDVRYVMPVKATDAQAMIHRGQLPPHLQSKILPPPTV